MYSRFKRKQALFERKVKYVKVFLKDPVQFRKILIEKGYSQRKFAREIDTSEAYFNQIINNKKHASPVVARKISNGLEMEFKDLFIIK